MHVLLCTVAWYLGNLGINIQYTTTSSKCISLNTSSSLLLSRLLLHHIRFVLLSFLTGNLYISSDCYLLILTPFPSFSSLFIL